MVATIEARRDVAIAMANQAAAVSVKKGTTTTTMVPLPGLVTENLQKGAADEAGWKAIAMREASGALLTCSSRVRSRSGLKPRA